MENKTNTNNNDAVMEVRNRLNERSMQKRRKNRIKKIAGSIVVVALAVVSAVTVFFANRKKSKKTNSEDVLNNTSVVNDVDMINTSEISDLGVELAFTDEKKEYGETTGNVDVNKIVKDSNGTTWANKEAASQAGEVGKVVTDTKGGTLEVKENGKVYEKQEGYEVIDNNGNVISSGEGSVPEGYKPGENNGEYVNYDENKYAYAEMDLYDENGVIKIYKGSKMLKEDYEWAKSVLYTKEQLSKLNSSQAPVEDPVVETPVETPVEKEENKPVNNGTYTDEFGQVWRSKSDYNNSLENPDGIYVIDGLLACKVKVLTK